MYPTQSTEMVSGTALGREADRLLERYAKRDPMSQFVLRIAAGVAVAGLVFRKEKALD
jgi:hypothetical protein